MMFTLEPPASGQFVRVWIYNNLPWATTYRWHDDELQEYVQGIDEDGDRVTEYWHWRKVSRSYLNIGTNAHYIIN